MSAEVSLKVKLLMHNSCKKRQKNPGQETGLRNRERLMVLNDTKLMLMIKGVTHAHLRPNWYHSEPSNVFPIPKTIFLPWTLLLFLTARYILYYIFF